MKDNSFLYLTQDDVISKIDIDPRLIPCFKRVMKKLQEHFNANGYTDQRNYKEYLEKFFLNSGENNMRIYVNKIDRKGVLGFYQKSSNSICIGEDTLNYPDDYIDDTMCHEFIHFLVHHDYDKTIADPSVVNGGFIDEALTVLLTQQVGYYHRAYDAQSAMLVYGNRLSGKSNNFSQFLKGRVDARYSSSDWLNFVGYADAFQRDFRAEQYIDLQEAQDNKNFLEAQRYLISLFIHPTSQKSFDEYCDCIIKLSKRPAKDEEYIIDVIKKLDDMMIRSLKVKDTELQSFLKDKLKKVREILSKEDYSKAELEELSTLFNSELKTNIEALAKANEQFGNLVRIERITLPNIDNKKSHVTVKVAIYEDKIVLLDNNVQIGNISNISLRRYIGKTSRTENAVIFFEDLGTLENAFVFSTCSDKNLDKRMKSRYSDELSSVLTEEEINAKIETIEGKEVFTEEENREEAIYKIAEERFDSLDESEKERIKNDILSEQDKFVLSFKDGKLSVSSLHGDIAYQGNTQVLYDSKEKGLLNEFYKEVIKKQNVEKKNSDNQINIDSTGNIVGYDQLAKKDEEKSYKELLEEVNKKLERLMRLYNIYGNKIENLMFHNAQYPIENYQQQLNHLIKEKDSISDEISNCWSLKNAYEWYINNNNENDHKNIISQVEKLLGIKISIVDRYVCSEEYKAPVIIAKDELVLREEQFIIYQKLQELYYAGDIDIKTYNNMKAEVSKEYEYLIDESKKGNIIDTKEEPEEEQMSSVHL